MVTNLNVCFCRSGDFHEEDGNRRQSIGARLLSSFDMQDGDRSPTSVKEVITDKIRSGSKSLLEKVLSPTKDKYSNTREKVSQCGFYAGCPVERC